MYERVQVGGRRHYETPHGRLPSVTTILSETKSAKDREGLAKWRARVGEAEANRVATEAAARGTKLHGMVESYLLHGVEGEGPWWNSIASFVRSVDMTRPFTVEQSVSSPLGYAGAYDLLGWCGEGEVLIDWKSSGKRKQRIWCGDYECQAAAYCGAINTSRREQGLPLVQRAAIVIAYQDRQADVFILDSDDLKTRWREFNGRLQQFQMRFGKAA